MFGKKKKNGSHGKKSKELLAKTLKCKKKLKQNINNDTHYIVQQQMVKVGPVV